MNVPVTSTPNAYAILGGNVLAVNADGNAGLVNLIIYPNEQTKINFPRIKYIIYRGIRKDSIADGSGNIIDSNNTASSDLTKNIWDNKTALNSALGDNSTPGFDILNRVFQDPSDLLQTPLFRTFFQTGQNLQLPNIKGGQSIGVFNSSSFGVEIVVEKIGYEMTVADAQKIDNVLTVTALPGASTQGNVISQANEKEIVLSYLDVCGFYGSFFDEFIYAKSTTDDEFSKIKEGSIYSLILSYFINKQKVYLDVRNENNHSYDYYYGYRGQNFASPQKLLLEFTQPGELGPPTYQLHDYYRSGWPLFVIDPADFPALEENFAITIAFPKGNNPSPILYVAQGKFKKLKGVARKNQKSGFELPEFQDYDIDGDNIDETQNYTQKLHFQFDRYDDGGTIRLISSYTSVNAG